MTGDDETPDVGHEEREKAFVNSENHALFGEKLQPYSMARRVAAQSIELRYGDLDSAHRAKLKRTYVYPGAFRDVAVVLWLCSLRDDAAGPNGEIKNTAKQKIDRAARDSVNAPDEAYAWLETKGIVDETSPNFIEAYILFTEIMSEVEVSRASAEKKMINAATS